MTPDRTAFTFTAEGPEGPTRELLTFAAMDHAVDRLAARLAAPGWFQERAVLFFQPGLAYIQAFFACLRAGVIAVPAYPPKPGKAGGRNLARLETQMRDCRPRLALTTRALFPRMADLAARDFARGLTWLIVDDPARLETLPTHAPAEPRAEHTAFLQYTSGSTSTPKGVVVSHGNIAANEDMIQRAFGTDPDTTCVGWLPLYHDMGLIGNVLQPVYAGFACHLTAPTTFLRRPAAWLEMVSETRAVISGGPNFAYELCSRQITEAQAADWDLSCWRVAFNGSEPIRAETLKQFAARFAPQGFRASAFFPCYGLAEATLMISGKGGDAPTLAAFEEAALHDLQAEQAEADAPGTRELVGSGIASPDQRVAVVSPQGQALPEGRIGEIWCAGPHVAQGYWQNPEATQETFRAHLAGDDAGPYMRTGDLGFLHRGELFITGRLKELIILRGRNYYPQDIERTAQAAHPALPPDSGAAFAVETQAGTRLVLVQEVARTHLRRLDVAAVTEAARAAVAEAFDLALHNLVLIRPATLPKTTSGKIRRRHTRDAYLAGTLSVLDADRTPVAPAAPAAPTHVTVPTEAVLAQTAHADQPALWLAYVTARLAEAAACPAASVRPDAPVSRLGLDSLAAVSLVQRFCEEVGRELPLDTLQAGPTPRELAEDLCALPHAAPPAAPVSDPHLLSANQSAMWLLHRLHPEGTAYHLPVALRLRAPLDAARLHAALKALCARHSGLRTRFPEEDGSPRRVVDPAGDPPLTVVDLADGPDALRTAVADAARRPLDPATRPWTCTWFRTPDQQGVLLTVFHHILADMQALLVLFHDLGTLVADPRALPEPPAADDAHFIAHQRRCNSGAAGERLEAYWRARLQPAPPVLHLPTDRTRPVRPQPVGAAHDFDPGLDGQTLRAAAMRHGVTPFAFLMTVWQVLLYRYSGQRDFCVGTPVAGRTAPHLHDVAANCVNTLALRADFAQPTDFAATLQHVAQTVRGALAHQDYPFSLLVARLCPQRDAAYPPVFQAMFSLQKPQGLPGAEAFVLGDETADLALGGLRVAPYPLPVEAAQVDLHLVVVDTDTPAARLVYHRDLFLPETAAQLAGHLRTLLAAAVAQPELSVDRLPLLEPEASARLLADLHATAQTVPPEPVHHRIARMAVRHGDATALILGSGDAAQTFSYAHLNEAANRAAHGLRARGIGPEHLVGLCMTRTPDLVVALLAVLKAGAAYIPLDPSHPRARNAGIAADAGMALLLVDPDTSIDLQVPTHVIGHTDPHLPVHEPDVAACMARTAYVIYTSGSTGKPKGVQVSHGALANFLHAMAQSPGLTRHDTLLAVTTVSFDIAGLELYLPLAHGARLVLARDADTKDGTALRGLLEAHQVTVMQATPSGWRLLLDAGARGPLKALCGGEALPGALTAELLAADMQVYNMYGPTETTIWSAVRPILEPAPHLEPVGGPIANTGLYVLDALLQPLPPGMAGELLIGGDGLARGYLNQGARTATAFIPNPFADQPGSRMYKTGDLVQRRADGTIAFLGRKDFQVKLRGYRIEIGEIEAALLRHPGIAAAAVALTGSGDAAALTAWLVLDPAGDPAETAHDAVALAGMLRPHLRDVLPEYMVPSRYVVLPALPLTPNGKIDRKALPEPRRAPAAASAAPALTGVAATITEIWRACLPVTDFGPTDNFFDLGGNSMLMARVHTRLKAQLGVPLTMVDLFQFPTVAALADHLQARGETAPETSPRPKPQRQEGIAVIGMACRFPDADTIEAFWDNLRDGKTSLRAYGDALLAAHGVPETVRRDAQYVARGSFLAGADQFDAGFFDYSAAEASLIDPQQRVFLEVCRHALEHGGCDPETYGGRIGVYAGSGMNTYLSHNLIPQPGLVEAEGEYRIMTTNDKDFLATRVAYKLNLRGPAVNVQTACSTSLLAVHEACRAIWEGACDAALAGGVTIRVPLEVGYLYREGLVFSPDGHCRAFDRDAGGTVPGSGAGAVLLKPLSAALADGDTPAAVIKGSAINNDARRKVGFTAPSVEGQRTVIEAAHAAAGVDPDTITYIEAHGTGTKMGDPIEIAALTAAFRTHTARTGYCAVGSVKTNIGHLDTAAGIAGLIKCVLALKHATLPASLNFQKPNPEIDFAASPFYVQQDTAPWQAAANHPRRAGVSSFGIGGTNVHVVLEEAPAPAVSATPRAPQRAPHLFVYSARTEAALDAVRADLADYLTHHPDVAPASVARALMVRRTRFEVRGFVTARDTAEAAARLRGADPKRLFQRRDPQTRRATVMMFPGQGAQYPGMAAALYAAYPDFRAVVDRCCDLLAPRLGLDLRTLLYPPPEAREAAADRLQQTQLTQPALFVTAYALAELLRGWGITPRALVGHSIGEYVAACVAGVFSLEDALTLVAERGRLIAALPGGAMLSVPLDEAQVRPLLGDKLSLAAVNGPNRCVVSGSTEAVAALAARLELGGTDTRHLHTSHAFHSQMMDDACAPFAAVLDRVEKHAPRYPIISNLDGAVLSAERACSSAYWVDHLRGTVRFDDCLTSVLADPEAVLLEVGPGTTLTSLARARDAQAPANPLLNLLPPAARVEDTAEYFQEALGKAWLAGVALDGARMLPADGAQVPPLPLYPFQRRRFWIDAHTAQPVRASAPQQDDEAGRLYVPTWKRTPLRSGHAPAPGNDTWLIFCDEAAQAEAFKKQLTAQGRRVILVAAGSRFLRTADNHYTLNPDRAEDLAALAAVLRGADKWPHTIVHCDTLTGGRPREADPTRAFFRLLWLIRALASDEAAPVRVVAVSDGMHDVVGDLPADPHKHMITGLLKTAGQEHPHLTCRLVDFDPGVRPEAAATRLWEELADDAGPPLVAYRGRTRWERAYERLAPTTAPAPPLLRRGGCYLITGGLGGIGQTLAAHLAKTYAAKLILLSRNPPTGDTHLIQNEDTHFSSSEVQNEDTHFSSGSVQSEDTHFSKVAPQNEDTHFSKAAPQNEDTHFSKAAPQNEDTHLSQASQNGDTHFSSGSAQSEDTHFSKVAPQNQNEDTHLSSGSTQSEDTHLSQVAPQNEDTHFSKATPQNEDTHFSSGSTQNEDTHHSGSTRNEDTHFSKVAPQNEDTHFSKATPQTEDTHHSGSTRNEDTHFSKGAQNEDTHLASSSLDGAEAVLTLRCDVTDAASVARAVALARAQFGRIDGVLHAAGIPGGGALAHRDPAEAARVFAPKVTGTLHLEQALADDPPDFMVLFSSVNAVLGGFGQADYAAANAFQDAFAQSRADGPTRMLSINWDSWHSVGMAVSALHEAAGIAAGPAPTGTPLAYPLFDCKQADAETTTYWGTLDVARDWPLHEHWILDRAILPGTTYLEMARAAYADHTGATAVCFEDVAFLAPLIAQQGRPVRTRTVLTQAADGLRFTISGKRDDAPWTDHAVGTLVPPTASAADHDLAALLAAHPEQVSEPLTQPRLDVFHIADGMRDLGTAGHAALRVVTDGKQPPEVSIELGGRWDAARTIYLGAHSGIAEMRLHDRYADDLATYHLHPALLDFAVGFLRLFHKQAHFLPLAYKRLTQFQPLPARFYSYIRQTESARAGGNPVFDILLLDPDGRELVRIDGFSLGRIDAARLDADEAAARTRAAELAAFTRDWLSPQEGIDAFERALASGETRLVVSTRDWQARLEESLKPPTDGPGALHGQAAQRPLHPRPDLMNPYVAPRDDQERRLAEIWQEVMGLEKVGIGDDFNDLGGDSLLITRIHARIKETFPTDLSVAELMQYANIADLSAFMRGKESRDDTAAKARQGAQIARQGRTAQARTRMKQARTRNPLSRTGKK